MKPRSTVVIGASAGAIDSLAAILPSLPPTLAAAIAVVVHMGPQDPGLLPELFAFRCQARVKEAEDKEPLTAGTVYFAPVDYHLQIEDDLTFSLSCDGLVNFSRPSIDVLLESAAAVTSTPVLAVILSGANNDGAAGANAIMRRRGTVFIQAPDTAVCDAMPKAAMAQCPTANVIPLQDIANHMLRWIAEHQGGSC